VAGLPGGLGGLAANAGSEALAFGLGFALGRALEPAGTELRQEAWQAAPIKAPDAALMAAGVAQGQVDPEAAASWAKQEGYGDAAFAAMVDVANVGPPIGYAFKSWRRGDLTDDEFITALRRTGLEVQWDAAMRALKDDRLDLGAIATAVHRGILAGQGLIVTEPPTGAGKIPRVPASELSATDEAAAHGIDAERLRILVGNTGLPLALGEMLRLLNLGEVTEDDVRVAVAESNIRNEYMDAALLLRRRLLTPHEYEEAALRGIISTDAADAGAALSGMEQADAQLLFQILGRPLGVHQITTGIERGGAYGGTYDDVPEPYRDAIRRSNIRPEYARLAYANRYTIPSYFVLRALMQSGALTRDEGAQYFRDLGWPPALADSAAAIFATSTGAHADPHVAKAQTQLWGALHTAYVDGDADDAQAGDTLTRLGVEADAQPEVLALWQAERDVVRARLTPTQIRKAYGDNIYTLDEATQRLERLGYTPDDAHTLLTE